MVIVEDELKEIIFPKSDLLSDEPPMETELHLRQLMLLIQSLELLWKDRQDFYAFGNLTIYYSPNQRKEIYQETFRTPNYFWFDPNSLEFKGFQLMVGKYEEIAANEQGWLWSQQLELFLGIHDSQLRFFTPEGKLVPTPEEVAEKMARKLQDLGIDWRDLA